jgi:DNA-binding beta-propeller fold protein YncE
MATTAAKRTLPTDDGAAAPEMGKAKRSMAVECPACGCDLILSASTPAAAPPAPPPSLRPGKVKNPAKLGLDRVVRLNAIVTIGAVCFDKDDNIVLPLYRNRGVIVLDRQTSQGHAMVKTDLEDDALQTVCVSDSRGWVFVAEERSGSVTLYRSDGSTELTLRKCVVNGPHLVSGMALSRDESALYVCCRGPSVIKVYNPRNGAFLRDICAGRSQNPGGIAVLSNSCIAVVDCTERGKVRVFQTDGVLLRVFGEEELWFPSRIAVDADDNLYVTNARFHNVIVYSSADGHVISRFGSKGGGEGQFEQPFDIAIDSAGTVVVTEVDDKRVQLFKSE